MTEQFPAVAAYFQDNWQGCSAHWAEWGRLDILDKNCHTNNLLERWFGILKYDFLRRKTQSSITELMQLLLDDVVPAFMDRRCLQLSGRMTSALASTEQRQREAVQAIVEAGGVYRCPMPGLPPGHTVITTGGRSYTAVLGDLSCSCRYAGM